MESENLKAEILKTLDNIPDDILQDVLSYLKMIEQSRNKVEFYHRVKTLMRQDMELLRRLSQ